jgi:CRISPR-associated protein Cas1
MAIVEDLLVSDYGAFVGLHGGRLRVQREGATQVDAPLMHLRSVQVLTRSASISAAALAACCEAGIPVQFVDPVEGNYASVLSPQLTTVIATRRAQLDALRDDRGAAIAAALAAGKIRSQAVTLRYLARHHAEQQDALLDAHSDLLAYADQVASSPAQQVEAVRMVFMGVEGYCARLYWNALAPLIPVAYAWPGRLGRGATDSANSLLNYGYGILYGEVQNALALAGLEPYAGLIHTDRPGKPSLTCDLIEEFRAPIVDRTVIGLLTRQFSVDHEADGRLTRDCRRAFADHILSRLRAQGTLDRKRYELRSIIQIQARKLAAAFRGESLYTAYTGG